MAGDWSGTQPIYRQLRDMVVAMIIDGTLKEGDAVPSVRQVSAEYRVNPITVLKSYQQLVNEDLVEKQRGVGMFVKAGARTSALRAERDNFLNVEWPRILESIHRLGLDPAELIELVPKKTSRSRMKERR